MVSTVAHFIAHTDLQGYAPSTICGHLSAIAFVHKLANSSDPAQDYIVQRAIMGCKKQNNTSDKRLPILMP